MVTGEQNPKVKKKQNSTMKKLRHKMMVKPGMMLATRKNQQIMILARKQGLTVSEE